MRFDFYVHNLPDPETLRRLDRVEKLLAALLGKVHSMSSQTQAALDDLATRVNAMVNTIDAAVVVIDEIAQAMRDAADDPAEIRALADRIEASGVTLATAISNVPTGEPQDPPADPLADPPADPAPEA